ncbi:hypothetical protein EYF80_025664 [Liparis tanakae]|uniref:Uncharacterized protein n=1 Tax=Liparis tanakae TaxID=230148 RepID=A0A4Z2HEM6_9TELE|nr:hypothetical protein EYF80_025664 [Liparis tanakae]
MLVSCSALNSDCFSLEREATSSFSSFSFLPSISRMRARSFRLLLSDVTQLVAFGFDEQVLLPHRALQGLQPLSHQPGVLRPAPLLALRGRRRVGEPAVLLLKGRDGVLPLGQLNAQLNHFLRGLRVGRRRSVGRERSSARLSRHDFRSHAVQSAQQHVLGGAELGDALLHLGELLTQTPQPPLLPLVALDQPGVVHRQLGAAVAVGAHLTLQLDQLLLQLGRLVLHVLDRGDHLLLPLLHLLHLLLQRVALLQQLLELVAADAAAGAAAAAELARRRLQHGHQRLALLGQGVDLDVLLPDDARQVLDGLLEHLLAPRGVAHVEEALVLLLQLRQGRLLPRHDVHEAVVVGAQLAVLPGLLVEHGEHLLPLHGVRLQLLLEEHDVLAVSAAASDHGQSGMERLELQILLQDHLGQLAHLVPVQQQLIQLPGQREVLLVQQADLGLLLLDAAHQSFDVHLGQVVFLVAVLLIQSLGLLLLQDDLALHTALDGLTEAGYLVVPGVDERVVVQRALLVASVRLLQLRLPPLEGLLRQEEGGLQLLRGAPHDLHLLFQAVPGGLELGDLRLQLCDDVQGPGLGQSLRISFSSSASRRASASFVTTEILFSSSFCKSEAFCFTVSAKTSFSCSKSVSCFCPATVMESISLVSLWSDASCSTSLFSWDISVSFSWLSLMAHSCSVCKAEASMERARVNSSMVCWNCLPCSVSSLSACSSSPSI